MHFDVICLAGPLNLAQIEAAHEVQLRRSTCSIRSTAMQHDIKPNRFRRIIMGRNNQAVWLRRSIDCGDKSADEPTALLGPAMSASGQRVDTFACPLKRSLHLF